MPTELLRRDPLNDVDLLYLNLVQIVHSTYNKLIENCKLIIVN